MDFEWLIAQSIWTVTKWITTSHLCKHWSYKHLYIINRKVHNCIWYSLNPFKWCTNSMRESNTRYFTIVYSKIRFLLNRKWIPTIINSLSINNKLKSIILPIFKNFAISTLIINCKKILIIDIKVIWKICWRGSCYRITIDKVTNCIVIPKWC